MARKRKKLHRLIDPDQREALTSPVRMEVLEHFAEAGPAAVREVAGRMGRTPHSIHYHVRRLAEVGLLRHVDTRKSGPRDEAIYDLIADRFEMPVDGTSDEAQSTRMRTVRALLRRAERDFSALASTDPGRLNKRDCFTARLRGRLSAQARDEVIRHMRAIDDIFRAQRQDPPARGSSYAMTVVLLPETTAD